MRQSPSAKDEVIRGALRTLTTFPDFAAIPEPDMAARRAARINYAARIGRARNIRDILINRYVNRADLPDTETSLSRDFSHV